MHPITVTRTVEPLGDPVAMITVAHLAALEATVEMDKTVIDGIYLIGAIPIATHLDYLDEAVEIAAAWLDYLADLDVHLH